MNFAKIKEGTITLKNGTRIKFNGYDGSNPYVGVIEVFEKGNESERIIDADEVHYWLDDLNGKTIYDGFDYKISQVNHYHQFNKKIGPKRALLKISPHIFINMIKSFKKGKRFFIEDSNIPDDAKFINAFYDNFSQCMYLVLESEEFRNTSNGERYPITNSVIFKTVER